jgi:hypothetical protein
MRAPTRNHSIRWEIIDSPHQSRSHNKIIFPRYIISQSSRGPQRRQLIDQQSKINIYIPARTAQTFFFFFGKLTYVLKEEDTNIIRGIPQIYNDNRNIKQQMATG